MKIVITDEHKTRVYSDEGKDILEILANHGIYLKDIVLRITPHGVSLHAQVESGTYVIETPNSLMNIVEALNHVTE